MAEDIKEKKERVSKFVSKEEFSSRMSSLENSLLSVVDLLKVKSEKTEPVAKLAEQVAGDKAVTDAKAYQAPINPKWEEGAKEILGDKLDHCEVDYPLGGGTQFTVVIKPEFSNAPKAYIERYKFDRRTKEIGATGYAGVTEWCNQVKANLANKK